MAAKQEEYKIISATVYASDPHRDCAIAFSGEEDFRMFLTMPKAGADRLADQLRASGYGTGARS